MKKIKILFVSHDATRTGAPIVLLTFLRWLSEDDNIDITIILKAGGPLEDMFHVVGETHIWRDRSPHRNSNIRNLSRLTKKFWGKEFYEPFPTALQNKHFDLVYLNTIDSIDLAPFLKNKFRCPVVAHIHENEYTIKAHYRNTLNRQNKQAIDRFIAVSKHTWKNLVDNHNISEEQLTLIYEFIDLSTMAKPDRPLANVKEELAVNGSFMVGGAGLTSWRKGIDLFIAIAAFFKRNYPTEDIKFIWVGDLSNQFEEQFDYEVKRLQLEGTVIFTGSKTNPQNYFQAMDVFLLSSREDPFPLVCLEAAGLGKPIICFDDAGGMVEFVSLGGGEVVPYGSIEDIVAAILKFKNDVTYKTRLGSIAKFQVSNYDVKVVGPQLVEYIRLCLKSQ